jgi:hypothetical protein
MALSDRSTDGEDDSAPYPLDYDVPDGVDERAGKLLATFYGVADVLEILQNVAEADDETVELSQKAVDALQEAFRVGEDVLDAPEYEAFLQKGPDALKDDRREAVANYLAPLAGPFFGVDLEWPEDDVDDATLTLDDITTIQGWRGS